MENYKTPSGNELCSIYVREEKKMKDLKIRNWIGEAKKRRSFAILTTILLLSSLVGLMGFMEGTSLYNKTRWDRLNGATWEVVTSDGDMEFTILHTNDVHAHLDSIGRRATVIQEIRDERGAENVLLLDAGDVFSGTLYFNLFGGLADLDFMESLGYDAMCLGNHEFDKFDEVPDTLENFLAEADFPILCANFNFTKEPKLAERILPWTTLYVRGEPIGIFGLTTTETGEISSPGKKIVIGEPLDAAKRAIEALENEGVTKIIALTHLGWDVDLQLARDIEGIDIIVGGHSHTVPDNYPTVIDEDDTPTLVVQAGEYGKYLGRLDLSFDDAGILRNWEGVLIPIDDTVVEDAAYAARLADYRGPMDELMSTVVGHTAVDLDGERSHVRTGETNLGNLIADSMLAKASMVNATIAIQNGGGIRASIPAGDVTLGEVMTVLPFENRLVTFDLTGEGIIAALENGVSQAENVAGRFPHVAGMRFTWDPDAKPGERVINVEIETPEGYRAIEPSAIYRVATNNFLYMGGDGYTVFQEGTNLINLGFMDYEVLAEYIGNNSPISPKIEGRSLEVSLLS